jgi:hypothetical protein
MVKPLIGLAGLLLLIGCGNGGPTSPTPGPSMLPVPAAAGPTAAEMYRRLEEFLVQAVAYNRELLPLNPGMTALISAKIALLERPGLALEMSTASRFEQDEVPSADGRRVSIAALFPADEMRDDSRAVLERLSRAMPVLEAFVGRPFRFDYVRVWYGFVPGGRSSLGTLELEDRAGFVSRATTMPYEAMVLHELAHSYVSNEALAQWLELYLFNLMETGSENVADWTFTRYYVAFAPSNANVAALLDVYQLIGRSAMSEAYRIAQPLGARYGEPLPASVQQVFVDQAPPAVQAQVRDLVARVSF